MFAASKAASAALAMNWWARAVGWISSQKRYESGSLHTVFTKQGSVTLVKPNGVGIITALCARVKRSTRMIFTFSRVAASLRTTSTAALKAMVNSCSASRTRARGQTLVRDIRYQEDCRPTRRQVLHDIA